MTDTKIPRHKKPGRKKYNRELHAHRYATDPKYREECRRRSRESKKRRWDADPEYREILRARVRRYAAEGRIQKKKPKPGSLLAQCEDCGKMTPGGVCVGTGDCL